MADEPHPQVQALLQMLDEGNIPPTFGLTPESAREQFERLIDLMEPTDVGEITGFAIEGPAGAIPVRAYIPDGSDPFPVLVYFHGGGWTIGNLDTHENVCAAFCSRANAVVVSVDYRLAPEHPFPAQLEDAYAAAEWASEFAEDISGDPNRIAVAGDSAGGNLAAAVSLMARDKGGPALSHQLLIYPAVASPTVHEFDSYEENAEGYFLERESMEWYYDKWLRDDADARNEYMAPLLARDLSGLPSATIVTAGFDPLRDEGIEYAKRLTEAGVDVRHENYESMIHGFVSLKAQIDVGDAAMDLLADELSTAFGD